MPPPSSPLEALLRRRYLLSAWPWRSLAYTVTSGVVVGMLVWPLFVIGLPLLITLILAVETWAGNADLTPAQAAVLILAGILMLAAFGPMLALPVAQLERWRLGLVHTPPVRSGHRTPPPGLWGLVRTRYTEPATWRETAYLLLLTLLLGPLSMAATWTLVFGGLMMVASPLIVAAGGGPLALGDTQIYEPVAAFPYAGAGVVVLVSSAYALGLVAGVHARLARVLLGAWDAERLKAELVEVTRSRARLVDAFEAERRRIERDLHDGAQQRLVALAMHLGLARLDTKGDTPATRALATAHEQAKELIGELRELIHGIHPQLLTDRGLAAALQELADRSPMPTTVKARLPHRFPAHVEATAYFLAAEALTNTAKHAEADHASVSAWVEGGMLVVEIHDDGRGGADPDSGTGLTGLADRVSVMDGRMLVSSPPGGPTMLRVELPGAAAE